jgi:recombination protein RecA
MATAKKSAATAPKVSALTRARAAIKTVLKEDPTVPLSEDLLKQSTPHIPTGSLIVDYAIGGKVNKHGIAPCPGLPRGRITQLYGQNSAGKTTLALTIAASVCAAGGTVAYIDWEHEVEPRYASALGVPIHDESRFLLVQPDSLEDGMKAMAVYINEGVDLIVLDSVGAGKPEAQVNREVGEIGDQTRVGIVAQKWSEYLPQVKTMMSKSGTTILAISQLRKTIAAMTGGPDSAPQGGEAWKFYTSVRIMLRVFQKEKAKQFDPLTGKMEEKVVGTIVVLKLDKCKVSDSVNNEFKFYLRSGSGIDNTRSVVELALNHKIITKSGAWYSWPTGPKGEVRSQGLEGLLKAINDDPKNLQTLFAQVTPKLMQQTANVEATVEDEDTSELDDILSSVPGVKAPATVEDEG